MSYASRVRHIRYLLEDQPLGTAGSLSLLPSVPQDPILVMNGDLLTNLDFNDLIRAHKQSGAALTIAGHAKQERIDLGVLEVDESGRLHGYNEKPAHKFEVSMGIYVYEPSVLRFIERDTYLDFPTLVRYLLEAGELVHVHRNSAFWLDIGRPEDYAKAQDIFERRPEYFGLANSDARDRNTRDQGPPSTSRNGAQSLSV